MQFIKSMEARPNQFTGFDDNTIIYDTKKVLFIKSYVQDKEYGSIIFYIVVKLDKKHML